MSDAITYLPEGILATPNLGSQRLIQLFESDNLWFVDADNGSSGNPGDEPAQSVTLVSTAEDKATAYGTIYVKPRVGPTGADVYYSDNIVIPVTKTGLAIIGAGNPLPGYRGAAKMQASTTTTHLIDVQAPNCTIENLCLVDNFTSSANIINCVRNATYPAAVCIQVRGCRFLDNDYCGSDGTTVSGAIALGSCQYSLIENNLFFDCQGGVTHWSTYGSPQSCVIRNNIFAGLVDQRDCDILIGMLDINSRGLVIQGNVFSDGLPAHATGSFLRFIRNTYAEHASIAATGMICDNFFAKSAGTYKAAGDTVYAPAGLFMVGNYQEPTAADLTDPADHVGRTN